LVLAGDGDFVSQVIACPNCEKKLSLRDELKGRTLVCPQCKTRFKSPADDAPGDAYAVNSAETESQGGAEPDFFDSLGAAPDPSAARSATKNTVGRSPATKRASLTRSTDPLASPTMARSAASRVKAKNQQKMMIYIGGAVGAGVLIVVVMAIIIAMSSGGKPVKKPKDENMRFGMTETQRRKFYIDLIRAVDDNGISKATQSEWRSLGREYKLSDQQIVDVLEEGLEKKDWEQPAVPATTDVRQKMNRIRWFDKRHETGHEPIMAL
jgi:hypothetical protein